MAKEIRFMRISVRAHITPIHIIIFIKIVYGKMYTIRLDRDSTINICI